MVRVCDTGMGIPPATLAHLFEPFMQGDQALDRSGGDLGLGLAVVKGLAEMHGGEVEAHSEGLGQGAQLTVRLPLERGCCSGSRSRVRPTRREAAGPA